MSPVCAHLDRIELTELPCAIAGCEDCLAIGGTWVAFYEAASGLDGWDTDGLASAWCPTPSQLQDLRAGAAATPGRSAP